VLRKHLTPEQFELVTSLAANLGSFPCEYDQQSRQFEPAIDTLDPETAEGDTLDAVLTACDILSKYVDNLDLLTVSQVAPPESGNTELVFDFDNDDPALPIFLSLLKPLTVDDAYQTDVRRKAEITQVYVTLQFYGEQDFQSKKDQVYLLRDITDRRTKDRPFYGNRL
jgi:hypothetical protein